MTQVAPPRLLYATRTSQRATQLHLIDPPPYQVGIVETLCTRMTADYVGPVRKGRLCQVCETTAKARGWL